MKPIVIAIAACCFSAPAEAHSWYQFKTDPVYKIGCCGGSDCNHIILPKEWVHADPGGYRLTLTLEQARTINPDAVEPVDTLIPWSRVQPSEDGNWHVCIYTALRDERGGVICFFAPPNS